jgi:hypothetical protein
MNVYALGIYIVIRLVVTILIGGFFTRIVRYYAGDSDEFSGLFNGYGDIWLAGTLGMGGSPAFVSIILLSISSIWLGLKSFSYKRFLIFLYY